MTDTDWKRYLIAMTLYVGKNGGHYYVRTRKDGTTYKSYVHAPIT